MGSVQLIGSDVHTRTQVEGGQTRRVQPRGYNKGEITEMYCRMGAHLRSRGGGGGGGGFDCEVQRRDSFPSFVKGVLNVFVTEPLSRVCVDARRLNEVLCSVI